MHCGGGGWSRQEDAVPEAMGIRPGPADGDVKMALNLLKGRCQGRVEPFSGGILRE